MIVHGLDDVLGLKVPFVQHEIDQQGVITAAFNQVLDACWPFGKADFKVLAEFLIHGAPAVAAAGWLHIKFVVDDQQAR